MRPPTELDLDRLLHFVRTADYDPVKAHEYYMRTRKLKGRQKGQAEEPKSTGRTKEQISRDARARQKQELIAQIANLQAKLLKLEDLIRQREREEASDNRKSKARKERAQKEAEKPDTAAEKAEKARESKKYREKHKQELKTKRGQKSDSGGGSSDSKKDSSTSSKKQSVSDLKALATKVKGQIAVAKSKLAAL